MMIKITEYCSMGCPHCMNAATTNGKDMTFEVLKDTMNFIKENHLCEKCLIITGGEPTEHKEFDKFMNYIIDFVGQTKCSMTITVTTNGEQIEADPERFQGYVEKANKYGIYLVFQVSADVRYYPRRISVHKRIFREPGFCLVDDCITHMYPQGRALQHDYKYKANAPKCANLRLLELQLLMKGKKSFTDLVRGLEAQNKFCEPHIKINGGIGIGESDLCPSVASIYDSDEEIIKGIMNNRCNQCSKYIDLNLNAIKLI